MEKLIGNIESLLDILKIICSVINGLEINVL